MNMLKKTATTLAAGMALMAVSAVQADTTWNWAYQGGGVTASGTFVTAGTALVPEDILSISGTRNGEAILGLVSVGEDSNFSYDNQFTVAEPHFTDGGLLFDIGGGDTGHINVYFSEGQYFDLYVDPEAQLAFEVPVSFSVSAVPEAQTYGYMALGLLGIGVVARRRTAA